MFGKPEADSILGVDISSSGVKLVEVKNVKNEQRLSTYGYSEFPYEPNEKEPLDDLKTTASLLKKVVVSSEAKSKRAIAGIPMSRVFSSIINVPLVPDKELQSFVSTQAQKLVSAPISEMQLDWRVLDREQAEKEKRKNLRVLVNGARRDFVQRYVDVFQLAGLELASLEPEAFALIRSLIGKDTSTIMLLDLGASRTNVSIVEKGVPTLNRSIKIGGRNLTEKIAAILGVSPNEAEETKRDIQFLGEKGASGMPKSVEDIMQPITNDVEYLFKQYNQDQGVSGAALIEKIVLTGGSAALPNLVEYLRNKLQVNAYIGDPWSRIWYPEQLESTLDEVGPRFAVAIGLALK